MLLCPKFVVLTTEEEEASAFGGGADEEKKEEENLRFHWDTSASTNIVFEGFQILIFCPKKEKTELCCKNEKRTKVVNEEIVCGG